MKKIVPVFFLISLFILIPVCILSGNGTSAALPQTPIHPAYLSSIPQTLLPQASEHAGNRSGNMTITFIDVAQGDAILVQSPAGKTMLIDAGRAEYGKTIVSCLKSLNVTSLDIVLATHPHGDHIGGLRAVITAFPVSRYIDSGSPSTSTEYRDLRSVLNDKNIPIRTVRAGDTIPLDPALQIIVLNPPSKLYDAVNDNSLVLRMSYGNLSFLLMGDTGVAAEAGMIASNITLKSDIVKVGHHGLGTSTSDAFVVNVLPKTAVISLASSDRSDHPDRHVLQRLEHVGSRIYRTDIDGTVTIISDGTNFRVVTERTMTQKTVVIPVPAVTA